MFASEATLIVAKPLAWAAALNVVVTVFAVEASPRHLGRRSLPICQRHTLSFCRCMLDARTSRLSSGRATGSAETAPRSS